MRRRRGRGAVEEHPTRPERAGMRPRDSRGRFRRYDTVIVIDEFGNIGRYPKRSETKFGYAVSVTEEPEAFGAITDDNRWKDQGERKARDDLDGQTKITRRIEKLGTRTYAYYVDKNDPPKEWETDDRKAVMLSILGYSLDRTLPETRGDVLVIVDHHSAYKGSVGPMIESRSRPWKTVDGDKYDSHGGEYSDMLQTHDYVANAVRGDLETGDSRRTGILRTKIFRIRDGELDV